MLWDGNNCSLVKHLFVEGIPGHDISEANLHYHSAVNAIPVYSDTNSLEEEDPKVKPNAWVSVKPSSPQ